MKRKRRCEIQKRKAYDRVCSAERRSCPPCPSQKSSTRLIMFVGDRGYGYGSRVKNHVRLGGPWKPLKHSLYASVCITNEHNTSQTCVFCFQKTDHPQKVFSKKGAIALKTVNGASVCNNNECILSLSGTSHKARDSVSALAIGISGASRLISGTTLEVFNPSATTTIR